MKLIRLIASWVLGVLTLGFILATASPIVSNAGATLFGSPGAVSGYRTLSVLNTVEGGPDELVFVAPVLSYSGKTQAAVSLMACLAAVAGIALGATRKGGLKRVGLVLVVIWGGLWVYGVLGFCRLSTDGLCMKIAPGLTGGAAVSAAWCMLRWFGGAKETPDG